MTRTQSAKDFGRPQNGPLPLAAERRQAQHVRPDPLATTHILSSADWIFVAIASILINCLALALPLLLLQIYDRIIPQHADDSLHFLLLLVGFAIGMECALRFLRQRIVASAAVHFEKKAADSHLRHFLTTAQPPVARHDGRLIKVLAALADWREAYVGPYFTTLCDLPFVTIYIAMIATVAGLLALIPIAVWCFGLALWRRCQSRLTVLIVEQAALDFERNRFSWMALESRAQTRSLYDFRQIKADYGERLGASTGAAHEVQFQTRRIMDISGLLIESAVVAVVCAGACMVVSGHLTTGALAATTLLAARSLQPLQQLSGLSSRAAQYRAARRQLAKFSAHRNILPAACGKSAAISLKQESNDNDAWPLKIDLENARLNRDEDGGVIFNNVNLHVAGGEFVAITGPSGSGKSALLQVLAGLVILKEGTISIRGIPFEEFAAKAAPGAVALVLQSEMLLQASVLDNLTLFDPSRRDAAQILARKVGLHEQITKLPQGYYTVLTEQMCATLAVGFQQRLALARALLDEPGLLLFDDASGALDDSGDASLRQILASIKGKTTIVMVTQRPAMLAMADRTLRLANGKLSGAEG